ncbi:MAG: AraC family transcriptional regulator, partial [Lachnospiraceae bacterium]|nr:AraC family transcriptional regulator [Lachnospiraceae bacterium]
MFHTGYCDYNRFNPDCDIINRPEGSGDYLFLYFMAPMKVQMGGRTHMTREGAFLLYTPGEPQIYEAVRQFKNSFVHFTCDDDGFLTAYD